MKTAECIRRQESYCVLFPLKKQSGIWIEELLVFLLYRNEQNLLDICLIVVEKIQEDPVWIRLKFEPKGRGHADDPFYLSQKKNICVCCGAGDHYLRHSIVPHAFKKYFDETLKSRDSHDVVLLCASCMSLGKIHPFFLMSPNY